MLTVTVKQSHRVLIEQWECLQRACMGACSVCAAVPCPVRARLSAIYARRKSRLTSGTAVTTGEHIMMTVSDVSSPWSRRGCASRQTVQLSMLPSHPAVDCTHCDRRLRLWPDQEMAFTCDQCEYESSPGWDVVRSSDIKESQELIPFFPRYHCFPCDYTLCSDCARNIEAILRGAWNSKPTENCAKMDQKLLVFQS